MPRVSPPKPPACDGETICSRCRIVSWMASVTLSKEELWWMCESTENGGVPGLVWSQGRKRNSFELSMTQRRSAMPANGDSLPLIISRASEISANDGFRVKISR